LSTEYFNRDDPNRIKASRLRGGASFEDYDLTAKRSLTKSQLKKLYSLKWLKEERPVIMVGQTGVGKPFLVQATGLDACQSGKSTLFVSMTH
jgi:DNA replication protein DnaC